MYLYSLLCLNDEISHVWTYIYIYIVFLSDKIILLFEALLHRTWERCQKRRQFSNNNQLCNSIYSWLHKQNYFLTYSPLLHRHGVVRFKMHSYCYDVLFFQQICGVQYVYCLINFWYVVFFIDLKWNLEKMQTDHIERFIRESCFKSW